MNDGCCVNSHLRNLPTSILKKRSNSWYIQHKLYTRNKASMAQLVEQPNMAVLLRSSVRFMDIAPTFYII